MAKNTPGEKCDAKIISEDINPTEIDSYVGVATIEFNTLEQSLQSVLQIMLKSDPLGAVAVWNSLMWAKRLELIDTLTKNRPELTPIIPFWSRIHEFLREIGGDRNHISHGNRRHTFKDGELIEEAVIPALTRGFEDLPRRKDKMDTEEIRQIILDIRAAKQAIKTLNDCLLGRGPSPQKLATTAIRRRPPRDHRKNTKSGAR